MIKNLTDASLYKKHVFPRKKSCDVMLHVRCIYTEANGLTNNIIMILLQAHDFE